MLTDCWDSWSSARNRRSNLVQLDFCRLTVDSSMIPGTVRSERVRHSTKIEFHQVEEVYRRRRTKSKLLQSLPLSLALSIWVLQLSRNSSHS